uniref:Uncharacterized protein n=1 Tax=Heterorhabditis bacteriophora TaxID=37862 RepID=A0A1I7WDY5_HETBA
MINMLKSSYNTCLLVSEENDELIEVAYYFLSNSSFFYMNDYLIWKAIGIQTKYFRSSVFSFTCFFVYFCFIRYFPLSLNFKKYPFLICMHILSVPPATTMQLYICHWVFFLLLTLSFLAFKHTITPISCFHVISFITFFRIICVHYLF